LTRSNPDLRPWAILLVAALLCAALAAPIAAAGGLDEAKAAGWVGERPNGYLGIVPTANPPASAQALVEDINRRRHAHYLEIAQREGTDVDVVAALAGKKLIERTPAGHYVMNAAGQWVMK